MCTHIFGATSLSSCSNYDLRRTAVENETVFGEAVASAPHHNFYVDDRLNSIERRPRFSQNEKNEKKLGICWNLREDIFSFRLKLEAGTLN